MGALDRHARVGLRVASVCAAVWLISISACSCSRHPVQADAGAVDGKLDGLRDGGTREGWTGDGWPPKDGDRGDLGDGGSLVDVRYDGPNDLGDGSGPPLVEPAVVEYCSPGGWCWQGRQRPEISAAWARDDGSVIHTVGWGGVIGRWDGKSWSGVSLDSGAALFALWGFAPSATQPATLFAVGANGAIAQHAAGSWTEQAPLSSDALYDVWGSSPSDVWAVGENGTTLHFDGVGWQQVSTPTTVTLRSVDGSGPNDVYASGAGVLLRYDGTSWKSFAGPAKGWSPSYARRISVLGPQEIYLLGDSTWRFDGTSWQEEKVYVHTDALWADGAKRRGLGQGYVLEKIGGIWMRQPIPGCAFFQGLDAGRVWAHGTLAIWKKTVMHLAPSLPPGGPGGSCEVLDPGAQTGAAVAKSAGIWGTSGQNVYATLGGISHFDGVRWTRQLAHGDQVQGIWGADANAIFAVGKAGRMLQSDGTAWRDLPRVTNQDLHGVWGSSANDVYAVGANGVRLHYDGTSWTTAPGTMSYVLQAVHGCGPQDVYAVGHSALSVGRPTAVVLHKSQGAWQLIGPLGGWRAWDVRCRGPNDVFLVGDYTAQNGVVVSKNATRLAAHYDGTSWSRWQTNAPGTLHSLAGRPGDVIYAASNMGEIVRWDPAAAPLNGWHVFKSFSRTIGGSPVPFFGAWVDPSTGDYWVGSNNGFLVYRPSP